ncbi:hypothetical protein K461DRAFT_266713 [Myriangium duriaei CBS 260.36]|uniref:Hydrophobin n=1 Tax=Myriangium duriaei CBS 260.36 TaxID=1168546 RepID=A0A9P4J966_9PEZI|nr:hypothetical protein K461DRAFT_266713 [Myriangium duriaei CBS 260.36]
MHLLGISLGLLAVGQSASQAASIPRASSSSPSPASSLNIEDLKAINVAIQALENEEHYFDGDSLGCTKDDFCCSLRDPSGPVTGAQIKGYVAGLHDNNHAPLESELLCEREITSQTKRDDASHASPQWPPHGPPPHGPHRPHEPPHNPWDPHPPPNDPWRPPHHPHEPHDPHRPPYDPNRPPYDPNRPPYDPNRPPYDPNRPPYDPNRPPYDPNRPPYDPNRPPYDPNRPPYDPSRPPYDPNNPNRPPRYPPQADPSSGKTKTS